jgi:NAD(P)-dependent dehydrogenase (short-subunit alcohol dehydrogenase family)
LAVELAEYNIQVNALAPGGVNTRFLDQVLEVGADAGKYYEKALKQRESGGISPDKAANLALFLATNDAPELTGRLFSATWDDWTKLNLESVANSSLYQMRRIDGVRYHEEPKS